MIIASPPHRATAAQAVIIEVLSEIFDLAHEMTGAHTPAEIDAEREWIREVRAEVMAALQALPQVEQIKLGRRLWELTDARDFSIAQLERDYGAGEDE